MLAVLGLVESGKLELISSEALEFEIDRMPDIERQVRAKRVLTLASRSLKLDDEILAHAQVLNEMGIKPLDALHLAFASWARVAFFCDFSITRWSAMRAVGHSQTTFSPSACVTFMR